MKNEYLEPLIGRLKQAAAGARREFGALSPEQLNWKENADRWSVGQCLDHIVHSNEQYFPELEALIAGTWQPTFWERIPWLPEFWGRMLLGSIQPEPRRRLKAPRSFEPTHSTLDPGILPRFEENLHTLTELMRRTDGLDHHRTMITSPASPVVTYSLFHCFNILTNHVERHLGQARRVLALMPGKTGLDPKAGPEN